MHKLYSMLKRNMLCLFKENLQFFLGDIIQSDHKQGFHNVIDAKYYKQ